MLGMQGLPENMQVDVSTDATGRAGCGRSATAGLGWAGHGLAGLACFCLFWLISSFGLWLYLA